MKRVMGPVAGVVVVIGVVVAALAVLGVVGPPTVSPSVAPPRPAALTAPARPAPAPARPAPAAPAPARPAPAAGPAAPPALATLPAGTTQAVVVSTPSAASTHGTVSTWSRPAGGPWTRVLGPVTAAVGRAGTGASSESVSRTPAGTFGLTRAFGRAADPGTKLPWFHAGPNDWWVSDPRSPAYNTHQVCAAAACRFDTHAGENLDAMGAAYDDAVVIDANTNPVVPGRGSAFFLHVGSTPTAGCVATDRGTVVAILRWLDPHARPVITIGR